MYFHYFIANINFVAFLGIPSIFVWEDHTALFRTALESLLVSEGCSLTSSSVSFAFHLFLIAYVMLAIFSVCFSWEVYQYNSSNSCHYFKKMFTLASVDQNGAKMDCFGRQDRCFDSSQMALR